MTYSQNFRRRFPLSALLFLCLVSLGCAFASTEKQSSAVIEEAYIDLKQGFSLVIPAIWTRERIPVSSPRHNPDTVEWLVNSTNGYEGTFQVSVQNTIPLQQYLSNLENEHLKITEEMSENIIHPAGPALRWELEDNQESIILIIIEGSERRYIITARVTSVNYDRLLKTIERVINSFLILPN